MGVCYKCDYLGLIEPCPHKGDFKLRLPATDNADLTAIDSILDPIDDDDGDEDLYRGEDTDG